MNYSKHVSNKKTPQTEPIFGSTQVVNNAGGFSWETDEVTLFKRFLILGTEGGSYYVGENKLTQEHATNVIKLIKAGVVDVVKLITEISVSGRAPKNDPAIFALALAATHGSNETKQAAYGAIHKVCRTGTHLFTFCQAVQDMRGWSAGLRKGVAKFYTEKNEDKLAYQLIKYRQRNGWTHRDVLRLCHAKTVCDEMNNLLKWTVGKEIKLDSHLNSIVASFNHVQSLGTSDVKHSISLIKEYNLPWEAIPTELLNDKKVWEALLPDMGLTALIRNLGKMTSLGVLDSNLSKNVKFVRSVLENQELLTKSRVHPMNVLIASKTYAQGHGTKGSLSWTPVNGILDSLNDAFYATFGNVESTGKNILLGIDVSGSMSGTKVNNSNLTVHEAAGAMSLIAAAVEPNVEFMVFGTEARPLLVSPKTRLDYAVKTLGSINLGGTDCSLPFKYATYKKLDVDAFITYTDNETWAGKAHPTQELANYRNVSGKNSKVVNVQMAANKFTNNDPKDKNAIEVIGFDTSTPQVISEFIKE